MLGVLVALMAIGGILLSPYIRTPALIQNDAVISEAFADAVTQNVYQVGRGQDLYRSKEPVTSATEGRRWPDLCSASQIRTLAYLPSACLVTRLHWLAECRNVKGCASIEVNPTLLSDLQLKRAVTDAIREPCESLPANQAPSGTIYLPSKFNRKLLECDENHPVHGSISSVDMKSGLIVLSFSSEN